MLNMSLDKTASFVTSAEFRSSKQDLERRVSFQYNSGLYKFLEFFMLNMSLDKTASFDTSAGFR